eukprot:CAMPEP_0119336710 /NCGR_PEP_ID=MMETSP1333-20130426/92394_1 /TAXON_ID=418940 /ORGANISM="Scyphosphaera apsteinii, Strain RCC1455" /LENGTH=48 /DNA_ID= /DNA_START= /DNA_END= /DNA_ORIENTATION=
MTRRTGEMTGAESRPRRASDASVGGTGQGCSATRVGRGIGGGGGGGGG